MGSTSLAALTYHHYISFHLAGITEKGSLRSTFHTPCWMCQEPFFTAGLPTSCQDCTSLPHIPSQGISSWGLYRDVLFPRRTISYNRLIFANFLFLFVFVWKQVSRGVSSKRPVFSCKPEKLFGGENTIEESCFISH